MHRLRSRVPLAGIPVFAVLIFLAVVCEAMAASPKGRIDTAADRGLG